MKSPTLVLLQSLLAIPLLAALLSSCSSGEAAPQPPPPTPVPEDTYTPLIAQVTTPRTQIVQGTDGKTHAVYEIQLANARPVPATLQRLTVVDAANRERVLAVFEGEGLEDRVRSLSNAAGSTTLPLDSVRQVLVDLAFDDPSTVPDALVHHFELLGASVNGASPDPTQQDYYGAPLTLDKQAPIVVGPPLRGTGWVAYNGCCSASGVHRATGLPVNGSVHFAQRYAIDWIRMDEQGRTVNGDETEVSNYTAYGAEILAVADGTVISVLDELEDQRPLTLPDPATITLRNVDGNHVILDLGEGRHAFYAHMQKGSVTVTLGERVTRGQVLGKVGNTGNTSAPHLHFHVMDSPSVLGSSGLPFVIDGFAYAGQVPPALAEQFDQSWSPALFPAPMQRSMQLPLDLSVIDF